MEPARAASSWLSSATRQFWAEEWALLARLPDMPGGCRETKLSVLAGSEAHGSPSMDNHKTPKADDYDTPVSDQQHQKGWSSGHVGASSSQPTAKEAALPTPERTRQSDDTSKNSPSPQEHARKAPPVASRCDDTTFPACVHMAGQYDVGSTVHAPCGFASYEDFLFPDLRLHSEVDNALFCQQGDEQPAKGKDPRSDGDGSSHQYNYPQIVVMHPTKIRWRESSPVASTTFAFLVGLLTTVICAWPCGIIAVIAAKRARDSVAIGDFTRARRLVQNALIYSALSLIFGLIMWLVICWRTDVIVHSALRHGIADCH